MCSIRDRQSDAWAVHRDRRDPAARGQWALGALDDRRNALRRDELEPNYALPSITLEFIVLVEDARRGELRSVEPPVRTEQTDLPVG